mmetsp:Transcript_91440/g.200387  ORF Transcript_91440/g.200387 Transcript_91440/m.200387 type:complete len:160 (-) Transcript_91440:345-824(-)
MEAVENRARKFDLFSRVWCVAELVEAHNMKIVQNVCLISKDLIDANTGDLGVYLKLATLSVANCSAARQSDKDAIMSKIEEAWGIEEFDARLQATIFGPRGLLGKVLVGFDVIDAAARVALRVKAFAQSSDESASESSDSDDHSLPCSVSSRSPCESSV